MKTDAIDLSLYLAFAVLGFLAKFALERYSKHKDAVRIEAWRLQLSTLEAKLSEFYWPIYLLLQRGKIAWDSGNFREKVKTEEGKRFAATFDQTIVVENHDQTREIIQKNFHHFGGDHALEAELIKLLHHIDIYLALRESGSVRDPAWLGQRWPGKVEELIEKGLRSYQEEYDRLLEKAQRNY